MRFRALTPVFLAAALLTLSACGDKTAPAPVAATPVAAPATTTAPVAVAVDDQSPQAIGNRLGKTIATRYGGLAISQVAKVEGLEPAVYRVVIPDPKGDKIAYTNEAADFFFVGGELLVGKGPELVNVTKQEALTVGSKLYSDLPFDKAMKKVYGKGERQLVVFSDPDCPFCQQLEVIFRDAALNSQDGLNATVYTLPYPLDSMHPNADAKARQILCTADPGKAWEDWMTTAAAAKDEAAVTAAWAAWSKRNPAPTNCARAADVDAIKKIGYDLGINQTPTLMFTNGMPWFGILSRNELEQSWNYVAANPQPPAPGQAPAPAAPAQAPPPAK